MLSISHALTGAFIAVKVPNPIISVPLILASHYIEDWILHWDVGTGLSNGTRKKQTAIILELFDLAISAGLVYWFFQSESVSLNFAAWFGAFIGLLPDFLEAPRNFLRYNPWWLKPLNDFHHGFHHSTPNMVLGLLPQILVVGLIFLLR
jgi:hypothetical protein